MTADVKPLEEPKLAVDEPATLPSSDDKASEEAADEPKAQLLSEEKTPEEPKIAVEEPVTLPFTPEEPKTSADEPATLPLSDEPKIGVVEEPVKIQPDEPKPPEETKPVPDGKILMESSTDPEPQVVEEKAKETEVDRKSEDATTAAKISSFREESNFLSDLKEHERKAVVELCSKLEEAILENKLFNKDGEQEEPKPKEKDEGGAEKETPSADVEKKANAADSAPTQVQGEANEEKPDADEGSLKEEALASLWGVPLLPSRGSEKTDVVLLKFLRARDFKVKEAFDMLRSTLHWRKEAKIDTVLNEESLGVEFRACCYMDGTDREGHPVCYNVSGVFEDEGLYQKAFGTEEGRENFLRWRVQLMEEGIKKLDLTPSGTASLLQITDLKNSPGPSKKELRTTMKQAVELLQDNYPEFVARNIFINVPFWYYAFHALLSPFLTQRTRSKMVFVRPARVTETLLQYIPAEAIPIRYGGLKREGDTEFPVEDGIVSEIAVKASSTETVEIPAPEAGSTIVWDLTVLGWEVNYGEEFVPSDEGSYTVIIEKSKKMGAQDEAVRNSFRNNEPGKVILTIENKTYKKKKALFRYKTKSC